MARMRVVKPGLRTSRVVALWPFEVRYFWVLLWGYLDDHGRGLDNAKTIVGDCYPLDDKITARVVERWLTLIATTRHPDDPKKPPPLCRYEVGGRRYVHAVNWKEHQRPNRPVPSQLPRCPIHSTSRADRSESFTESGTTQFTDPDPPPSLNGSHEMSGARFEGLKVRGVEGARRESGSESLPDPTTALDPEPPPTCQDHRDDPDPPACRRCKAARERHEAWLAARRARLAAEPRCPEHPTELARNCPWCRSERLGAA